MDRYEIAVIGTGPAGFSAAITAKLRKKNIILLGSIPVSQKVNSAEQVDNYLGLPSASGKELEEAFSRHLAQMGISVTEDKVSAVYAMGDYFSIQAANAVYEAQAVILATGVTPHKTYPGESEYLGKGVSYCATCDAALYRGKTAAVVGFSKKEETEAAFLAEVADKVYYFPQYKAGEGKEEAAKQGVLTAAQAGINMPENVEILQERPVRVEGAMKAERLVTDSGSYTVDGIFFLRDSVLAAQLVPGLVMKDHAVEVSRQMETNIKGCFACGDLTGAPYQYMKAAGEGNVAALSAVSYLAKKASGSNQSL